MARLSPIERTCRWFIIAKKLLMVMTVLNLKARAIAVLGKATYLKIFQETKALSQQEEKKVFTKIIRGEVVGRRLPDAKPPATKPGEEMPETLDPEMCQHPAIKMVMRANKDEKWWTCKDCLGRWQRRSLETYHGEGPGTDRDIVTFGIHMGETYLDVHEDPAHSQWVMMTAEQDPASGPEVRRLAEYLVKKEAQMAMWETVPHRDKRKKEEAKDEA